MTLKELKNYTNWIDHNPFTVLAAVIMAGGWKHVFDKGVPPWASKVRNYFNVSPQKLTLLDDDRSETFLKGAQTAKVAAECATIKKMHGNYPPAFKKVPQMMEMPKGCPAQPDPEDWMGSSDMIGTRRALSGHVYEDEFGDIWYQMDPGGGIYHFPEDVSHPTPKAIWTSFRGQYAAPVFKLVSPDGTGGSRECCITNPRDVPVMIGNVPVKIRRATIGAVNEAVDVSKRHILDSVKQGSYNYAETIERGLHRHDRFDVHTDPMKKGFFRDPPDRFSGLGNRHFPPDDNDGKPLANQVG